MACSEFLRKPLRLTLRALQFLRFARGLHYRGAWARLARSVLSCCPATQAGALCSGPQRLRHAAPAAMPPRSTTMPMRPQPLLQALPGEASASCASAACRLAPAILS